MVKASHYPFFERKSTYNLNLLGGFLYGSKRERGKGTT